MFLWIWLMLKSLSLAVVVWMKSVLPSQQGWFSFWESIQIELDQTLMSFITVNEISGYQEAQSFQVFLLLCKWHPQTALPVLFSDLSDCRSKTPGLGTGIGFFWHFLFLLEVKKWGGRHLDLNLGEFSGHSLLHLECSVSIISSENSGLCLNITSLCSFFHPTRGLD